MECNRSFVVIGMLKMLKLQQRIISVHILKAKFAKCYSKQSSMSMMMVLMAVVAPPNFVSNNSIIARIFSCFIYRMRHPAANHKLKVGRFNCTLVRC